jgi:hypothetical protein
MDSLKARLEAGLCHPVGNILLIIIDGNNLSLKRKLDFINYIKTKTKPNLASESKNELPATRRYGSIST